MLFVSLATLFLNRFNGYETKREVLILIIAHLLSITSSFYKDIGWKPSLPDWDKPLYDYQKLL